MGQPTDYDEISLCNRCGFCQVACPVFRSTGHESGVARGRLALLRAILEKRIAWSEELEDPLFDCLLCGACTANCFPAVPTAELIVRARSEYLEKVGRKPLHRMLFDHLLPHPGRLHMAARSAALGSSRRGSLAVRALDVLRSFGRDFPYAGQILERVSEPVFRGRVKPGIHGAEGEELRIGFFVGCGMDILNQDAADATFRLLKKIGKSVHVLENCCCGLPAYSYGDLRAARRLAEKNLPLLSAGECDVIVSDCSSCASYLKRYPSLFQEGDERHRHAKVLSGKVQDAVQMLSSAGPQTMPPKRELTVTYHDPCHASRGQGIVETPREILSKLPGIRYVELPEADWCCGGAGAYALSHHRLSRKVLDRKIANLAKTGADIVATSCPACILQLSYGVRRHGLTTKVRHISEILARYSAR